MRQRGHVTHARLLPPERLSEDLAGGVVLAIPLGHRPLHHGADSMADAAGTVGLRLPERREDGQHVGRGHVRDGQVPDVRMHVPTKQPNQARRVLGAAPAGSVKREHLGGGFLECWDVLRAPSRGERVTARPRDLAVGEGRLAGFGERDERVAAEPEHSGPPAHDQPLHPAPRPRGVDAQIQPVPVAVEAGGRVAHELGAQSVREPSSGCRCGGV